MGPSQWEETASATASYDIKVKCFKSKNTGLSVIHADIQGICNGVVNGFFVLPTEAHDDDGCPHTLEHLVFMGSEDYPYKGVLDHIANRSFAQGTNAWTDTDHTAYTLTTAGAEGFLNILPVYVDHILYPTITDSAFYTEVHHINGAGEDGGVVYSEMQGRENTSSGLSFLSLQRSLYAGTGYASQTGGLMANLRSLTAEKVRSYHQAYYRPDNLTIIVTGDIRTEDIFKVLEPIENKISAKAVKFPPMERPFSTPVPPLSESAVHTVEFPDEDDESNGTVYVAWRGPKVLDVGEMVAVDLLWTYLTDTSVAPLTNEFVEADPPFCSEVGYMTLSNSVSGQVAYFSGVPMAQLDEIVPRLVGVLEKVAAEGLDMERMKNIITQQHYKDLDSMERNPHNTLATHLIVYVMYGSSSADLHKSLVRNSFVDVAMKFTNDDWVALLKKYFLGQPHVAILSKPSAALGDKMREEEAERVEKQRETLGEEKLLSLEKELENAVASNSVEVPLSLLQSFRIPDVTKISHIPVVSVECDSWGPGEHNLSHVSSEFVEINVYVDTLHLQPEDRLLLELYMDFMFEVPVRRDGVLVPYEQIVQELAAEVSSHYNSIGFGGHNNFSCGEMGVLAMMCLRVDAKKYDIGARWTKELLWQTEFIPERIRVAANRLLAEIPDHKRSGTTMGYAVLSDLNNPSPQINNYACNLIRQQRVLKKIIEDLDSAPERVVERLTKFRDTLLQASAMRVQVMGNVTHMSSPMAPIYALADGVPPVAKQLNQPLPKVTLRSALRPPGFGGKAKMLSMAAIESSFLFQSMEGPKTYDSEDLAPLEVLVEYLTAAEGIIWTAIRGNGLAYGAGLHVNVESGLLTFDLYKSSNLVGAYEAAKAIIQKLKNREVDFEEEKLQAAQSGKIFSHISREAMQSFINNHCTLLGPSALKTRLAKIQAVTVSDLYRVLDKYLVHIFDPARTNLVIAANPAKAPEIFEAIKKHVPSLEQIDDVDAFFA